MDGASFVSPACLAPLGPGDRVLLAHGEGARLTRRLIREVVLAELDNDYLRPLADAAVLPPVCGRLVFTADGHAVSPLFFPGGDIGRLAVYGTVNDLSVCGAESLYLSLGLIVEEGLPLAELRRVLASVAAAARECGTRVVTGDTKVVPRGAADRLFLHTAGVGRLADGVTLGAELIRPGDAVLVSGTVGDHGLAVLAAREGLDETGLVSDSAPVHELAAALLASGAEVRFLRDPTRGGVSAVLHEAAGVAGVSVEVAESKIPLSPAVRGAAEIFGLDPLYVANEGKVVAVVSALTADVALACLRAQPLGRAAAVIGRVTDGPAGEVWVRGALGQLRALDEPSGAPLPRIC
jgi:hydrogenase expression/formation protein HypE